MRRRLVPLSYNVRSLFVRRSATLLTVLSIGATVAVVAGVLALQQGFERVFAQTGRTDVVIFMRPGATSEGESYFPRERVEILRKSFPQIAAGSSGPLAGGEMYLAVRMAKRGGGDTNVPIRGVEPVSLELVGDAFEIEGRAFTRGTDEVIVGRKLSQRIDGGAVGDVIRVNTTPFRVVGVFEHDGPFASEIWGDAQRLQAALKRPGFNRMIARLRDGATLEQLEQALEKHTEVKAKVMTERDYLAGQTVMLSAVLKILGGFLAVVMGIAAVFTGTNTMLAALSARTHEIGILLSLGFRPFAIFCSFLFESLLVGLLGGIAGCLLVLPLHGVRTGTTNWQTFSEVAFAFQVTPPVLGVAVAFAVALGLLGGLIPAWSAASKEVTEALRRG